MNPIKGQKGFQVTRFCPNGHDKDIVGRKFGTCVICKKESTAKWKRENPKKLYESNRLQNWTRYGILNQNGEAFTLVDFDRHYQIQQGRCLICKKHQSELQRPLNVDHNHITKIFRGLLCDNCNKSLGLLGDSIEILESGIKYLRRGY
jgi:hypothetical protein